MHRKETTERTKRRRMNQVIQVIVRVFCFVHQLSGRLKFEIHRLIIGYKVIKRNGERKFRYESGIRKNGFLVRFLCDEGGRKNAAAFRVIAACDNCAAILIALFMPNFIAEWLICLHNFAPVDHHWRWDRNQSPRPVLDFPICASQLQHRFGSHRDQPDCRRLLLKTVNYSPWENECFTSWFSVSQTIIQANQ